MDLALISVLVAVAIVVILAIVLLFATAIVVPPGTIALLLKRGKATGRAIEPGRHFVAPWQKLTMQVYPSRELTLVAGGRGAGDPRVEYVDDALRLHLSDKVLATVSYTARCRLDTGKVREVHNRFGPEGIWAALRDVTRATVLAEVGSGSLTVDDVFGDGFTQLEQRLSGALGRALGDAGFELRMFTLREIDLGETGEVVQAVARANSELERERVTAELRRVRLENDAEMGPLVARIDSDVMLRYRQLDSWREILSKWDGDQTIPSALTVPLTAASSQTYHEEEVAAAEGEADEPPAAESEA